MRFFTYISDAKVDMLLAQIPAAGRKKIAQELKIDLGVLKLSHKREIESDTTRFAKVEAVAKYVYSNEWWGNIGHDASYIVDRAYFHWGCLRRQEWTERGTKQIVQHESQSPVLFGLGRGPREQDGGREIDLIMTGSQRHLIGSAPAGVVTYPYHPSSMDGFAWYVENRYDDHPDEIDVETTALVFEEQQPTSTYAEAESVPDELRQLLANRRAGESLVPRPIPSESLSKIRQAKWMWKLARLRAEIDELPLQQIEFLAKRLSRFEGGYVQGTGRGTREIMVRRPVVLASPIYVALAD